MKTIDFHNHFYPPEYLDAIRTAPCNVRVTLDAQANLELHYPGDCNIAVRGHRDIAHRAEVLDRAGVDRQVLTFTTPGTHVEEPARAAQLARLVNDSLAGIALEHAARLTLSPRHYAATRSGTRARPRSKSFLLMECNPCLEVDARTVLSDAVRPRGATRRIG
jgi:hypothetical protein